MEDWNVKIVQYGLYLVAQRNTNTNTSLPWSHDKETTSIESPYKA